MARKLHPNIDPAAPAWRVASLWGSNSAFARAIGRTPSTTHDWMIDGLIPQAAHADVIAAAKRDRKPLKPDHFVDRRLFALTPAAPAIEASAA